MKATNKSEYILYLASYPPRECGIATFTQDLATALDRQFNPAVKSRIAALNDEPQVIYNYGPKVVDQIAATELYEYVKLAKRINADESIKIVNIQHEFGLFGGKWGDYIIPFLQALEKPVVITLHSVMSHPDEYLRNVVRTIADYSRALIVMNKMSKYTLIREYGVSRQKVSVIPHGVPSTTFEPSEVSKGHLGLSGKVVLSTFGMLSKNKGVEYAIRALPDIVAKYPNVVYLVLGETHPIVRKSEGEEYRNFLTSEVRRLGLEEHVKFYNKYLTLDEIVTFLKATDVYISPSVDMKQSVSGTLSYALGCGRPIVSTSSEYAKYLINSNMGILVKPKSDVAIRNAIFQVLEDSQWVQYLSAQAYEKSRHMVWPNVAASYMKLYKRFVDFGEEEKKLPKLKLDHLIRLTDDFGVLHFAKYSTPDKNFGYSLDDNARALIAAALGYFANNEAEMLRCIHGYLNYLSFASRSDGTFTNIVSKEHKRDRTRDEDVQGRAIWALGFIASQNALPKNIVDKACILLKKSLRAAPRLKSPRATAFAMLGLYSFLKNNSQKAPLRLFKKFADAEVLLYRTYAESDWRWFEPHLTYSNAVLSEVMFLAYDLLENHIYLEVAEESLAFLKSITFFREHYSPIGQKGWFFRNKTRAFFDQQPEDTAHMVQAKLTAYNVTGKAEHFEDAYKAFQWFLGRNFLNQVIYDEVTGGCHDGLGKDGMNLNQGAESTISYLLARLSFENLKQPNTSLVQEA